jgi:hypothetical protein
MTLRDALAHYQAAGLGGTGRYPIGLHDDGDVIARIYADVHGRGRGHKLQPV